MMCTARCVLYGKLCALFLQCSILTILPKVNQPSSFHPTLSLIRDKNHRTIFWVYLLIGIDLLRGDNRSRFLMKNRTNKQRY